MEGGRDRWREEGSDGGSDGGMEGAMEGGIGMEGGWKEGIDWLIWYTADVGVLPARPITVYSVTRDRLDTS